ncbi:MAG: PQQ-dependent sugar dehydrogenase [Opitutaceae bacterium]
MRPFAAFLLTGFLAASLASSAATDNTAQQERGRAAYALYCASCHQASGEGLKGVFPPLAGSDFLMEDLPRSIQIVLQGISGELRVNGITYNGAMPPLPALEDDKVAEVLTYVRSAWGNQSPAVTLADVAAVRAKIAVEEKNQTDPFAPLPKPPVGFQIREVVKLPLHAVRLAGLPGKKWIFVLGSVGDIFRLEPATGNLVRLVAAAEYTDRTSAAGAIEARGMTIDSKHRLYVVVNQRTVAQPFHLNQVTIFRSAPLDEKGMTITLKPWLKTSYPWGNSFYTHGVGHIAEGPDGMIYVSSGSRTDGGEEGTSPIIAKVRETELTAGIWQLDPREENPVIKAYARGIRNPWTFAWNERGELFSASNGPDADVAEELDFVEAGKHYGFPYQFADSEGKPYPHTPPLPEGVKPVHAIRNFGPAGGGSADHPMATFDPHSSPTGMIFCGPEWPESFRGKFLVGRFGAMTGARESGFDVLALTLKRNPAGIYEAHTEVFLAPVARPIDQLQMGTKLYLLEYTRPTEYLTRRPMNPGRIVELSW